MMSDDECDKGSLALSYVFAFKLSSIFSIFFHCCFGPENMMQVPCKEIKHGAIEQSICG